MFRQMLRHENHLRGLVVHSNGVGGVGKSTLLTMFDKECRALDLPIPTQVFYFTADRPINWRVIVDTTVRQLGEENFISYVPVRSLAAGASVGQPGSATYGGHLTVQYVTNVYGNIDTAHTGSGNIEFEGKSRNKSISEVGQAQSHLEKFSSIETAMKPSEIRQFLTQKFLQDLNQLPRSFQVVWLIDTVEKLDDESISWLVDLYWELVELKTQRLIVVAAGRERFHHHPQWANCVEEIVLSKFTEEAALEILLEVYPAKEVDQLHRMFARTLIHQTDGEPLRFTMMLDSILKTMGVVYA